MKRTITKGKIFIIIILALLFVLSLATGIYLLVKPNTFDKSYNVDKYPDIVNWCDTKVVDNTLTIDCKGLLLNISNPENGDSCFEVQVITKDKELKDLTICEKRDSLTYTDEVLGYKQLMPIDMIFTYTQQGLLNSYSFSNVSFTKLDDAYIQSIVNEDIATLVKIDPTSTTIQNSVDFCPKPEKLPSYVTEENKIKYTEYFNKNIMTKDKYTNGYLYNLDDTTVRILFASDSASALAYNDILKNSSEKDFKVNNIKNLPVVDWSRELDASSTSLLKNISFIYDSVKLNNLPIILENTKFFEQTLNEINNRTVSEEVFCSVYKLYENMDNSIGLQYTDYIKNTLQQNISKSKTILCGKLLAGSADTAGIYIKYLYNGVINSNLSLFNRCSNLENLFYE